MMVDVGAVAGGDLLQRQAQRHVVRCRRRPIPRARPCRSSAERAELAHGFLAGRWCSRSQSRGVAGRAARPARSRAHGVADQSVLLFGSSIAWPASRPMLDRASAGRSRRRRCTAHATPRRCDAALALQAAPSSVTRIRAPDAPIGWPSAQAPPWTLTLSCGSSRSCIAAMVDHGERLVDFEQVDVGRRPAGLAPAACGSRRPAPSVNSPASCAWVAWPWITASGFEAAPSRAVDRRISTSAAAPSEIELEFAAVTVPSLRNAGLSCAILSGVAFAGCSSLSIGRPRPCGR